MSSYSLSVGTTPRIPTTIAPKSGSVSADSTIGSGNIGLNSASVTPQPATSLSTGVLNPNDMQSIMGMLTQMLSMLQSYLSGGQAPATSPASTSANSGGAYSGPPVGGADSGAYEGTPSADGKTPGAADGGKPSDGCHKASNHHKGGAHKAHHGSKGAGSAGSAGSIDLKAASGTPGGGSATPADKGSMPTPTGDKNMDQWDTQIAEAAKSTGLPANYIKATIWAESNGNPNDPSKNPDGKHTDLGVMQESDYTYSDVMKDQPNAPRGLKASNPADNIMMGAWELKDKYEKAGNSLEGASKAYRGHDDSGDSVYAANVLTYMDELNGGQKLSQDPHGNPDK